MQAKLAHGGSQRTLVLVFDRGEEVIGSLTRYAKEHQITAGHFTGIGAFAETVLGFFDWEKKDYVRIPIREQVELLSLAGDVAVQDGEPAVHAHAVVGKPDGTAHGGHLLSGTVRPTLELVLVQSPAALPRRTDPETGLALIRLEGRSRAAGRNNSGDSRPPRSRDRRRPPRRSVSSKTSRRRSDD